MEKMRMESLDMTERNIDKIADLFPNCITETTDEFGKLKKAVNFDLLRQMLSGNVVEGDEAYEFTWVGKKAAIVEANRPIRKTLRPCPEESLNWDTTENLYIEGDNLEVLKLLQESYLGKVKMIYIDPPYNTGSDFIYRDFFAMNPKEYEERMGMIDKESGNLLFRNTDSNGRFHSDWCSMIYSRLILARNLLRNDGIIFISIDDNELDALMMIGKEVFGADNFESCVTWRRRTNQPNDKAKMIAKVAENIVVFSKNNKVLSDTKAFHGVPLTEERKNEYKNPDNDPKGAWSTNPWKAAVGRGGTKYTITTPSGKVYSETWYGTEETFNSLLKEGRVYWTDQGNGYPRIKIYLSDAERDGQAAINFFTHERFGSNQEGSSEVEKLFGRKGIFDNPKPVRLISSLINLACDEDSIILDFFSGSATTAHAAMQINSLGGKRKYILVQIPEYCSSDSVAYTSGYKTICDIGKERIRRAGEKIKEENPLTTQNLDTGFRVFKLDDSNLNDVYYTANGYTQDMLSMMENNIKSDRTDLDLLFGCLLEWGLPLSMPYKSEKIEDCTVHTYNDGDLIACFDENIPDTVIKEIARRQPLRAVFRDSSFNGSPAKINVGEIFKMLAPDTRVKVI